MMSKAMWAVHCTARGWWGAAACTMALLSAGCQSVKTTEAGVIGIDRRQTMSTLVKESDLRQGAAAAYAQEMGKANQAHALNADGAMTVRVRAIAGRMVPVTATFRNDAPAWAWEVNVVQSDQLNAYCMPGGKIAFYSGLITKLQLSDDEIAAVMGHEIAHALREHGRERASEQMSLGIGAAAVGIATGSSGNADLARMALQVTVGLPNSRLHETEADRMGVELAARAGYDPRAAIKLWQKMAAASAGKGPEFLSTHPSAATRISELEQASARVMPLYDQARRR